MSVKRFKAPGPWVTRELRDCVQATDYDALAAERDQLQHDLSEQIHQVRAYDAMYVALLAQAERLAGALDVCLDLLWIGDPSSASDGCYTNNPDEKSTREALAAWREFSAK